MARWLGGTDPPGATPLDPDDLDGLIPTFVATRGDLNVAEQANIEKAVAWFLRRRTPVPVEQLLSIEFSDELHRRMFDDVWSWAGERRRRETNIGVDPMDIITEMKKLFDDARYWHDHATFESVERAVRIHHRLVSIHPYRNGNGRQTRLLADGYLFALTERGLSWGGGELVTNTELRYRYIAALEAAGGGDIQPLIEFATS